MPPATSICRRVVIWHAGGSVRRHYPVVCRNPHVNDAARAYTASTRKPAMPPAILHFRRSGDWIMARCPTALRYGLSMTPTEMAVAYTASTQARDADTSRDIDTGNGPYLGGSGHSDGTTLWFRQLTLTDVAVAYTASTRARDAPAEILHWAIPGAPGMQAYPDGMTLVVYR